MPVLQCPFAGCDCQTPNDRYNVVGALVIAHTISNCVITASGHVAPNEQPPPPPPELPEPPVAPAGPAPAFRRSTRTNNSPFWHRDYEM